MYFNTVISQKTYLGTLFLVLTSNLLKHSVMYFQLFNTVFLCLKFPFSMRKKGRMFPDLFALPLLCS